MRWRGRRQSTNIRDVRSSGSGGGFGRMGGALRGRPVIRRAGGGGIGIGAVIAILVISYFLGINPLELLSGGPISSVPTTTGQSTQSAGNDEMRAFVATVLADTEDTWSAMFKQTGDDYPEPTLTLFSGAVQSGCGAASAASGPFYCPTDRNLYIDLSFYDELRRRFGAPGDFAQAYVLAHEVGHHVQNVIGILPKVQEIKRGLGETDANALQVRVELQADCFAGVWAYQTNKRGLLEDGDVDEAIGAASAVGDDTLQRRARGYVVPDSFTHGTSKQRVEWFRRGFKSGSINDCDTFSGDI